MKLKKLALNAIAMDHSEMKQIKAGTGPGGMEISLCID